MNSNIRTLASGRGQMRGRRSAEGGQIPFQPIGSNSNDLIPPNIARNQFGGKGTAGFQTGCIADVPIGGVWKSGARSSGGKLAGLETRDTAGSETCGTTTGRAIVFSRGPCQDAVPREDRAVIFIRRVRFS